MSDELEKLDILRERMGMSYREAKECLQEAEGDLVEALIMAEAKPNNNSSAKWFDKGEKIAGDIVHELKSYINKGNQTRIKLKRGDKTIAEFPATLGALGALAALVSTELAVVAGLGTVAAVANRVSLEVIKPDGDTKVISVDRQRE